MICLAALSWGPPVAAQAQDAVVRGEVSLLEVSAGETAALNIVLAGARDVYAIDVRATFDPNAVEVVDADPSKDGIQLVPGAFPKPDFVARNVADNEAGTLRYAITQVNPTEPANGAGTIFTVQFRGKTPGATALTLGPVELADRQGRLLAATVQSVTIRVVSGQASTRVPAATQTAPVESAAGVTPTTAATAPAEPATGQPGVTQPPTQQTPPAGLPCAAGALPALGVLTAAGWGAWRRRRS